MQHPLDRNFLELQEFLNEAGFSGAGVDSDHQFSSVGRPSIQCSGSFACMNSFHEKSDTRLPLRTGALHARRQSAVTARPKASFLPKHPGSTTNSLCFIDDESLGMVDEFLHEAGFCAFPCGDRRTPTPAEIPVSVPSSTARRWDSDALVPSRLPRNTNHSRASGVPGRPIRSKRSLAMLFLPGALSHSAPSGLAAADDSELQEFLRGAGFGDAPPPTVSGGGPPNAPTPPPYFCPSHSKRSTPPVAVPQPVSPSPSAESLVFASSGAPPSIWPSIVPSIRPPIVPASPENRVASPIASAGPVPNPLGAAGRCAMPPRPSLPSPSRADPSPPSSRRKPSPLAEPPSVPLFPRTEPSPPAGPNHHNHNHDGSSNSIRKILSDRQTHHRELARENRKRRAGLKRALEESVVALRAENAALRGFLASRGVLSPHSPSYQRESDPWIRSLKRASRKALDERTLSWLRSLRSNLGQTTTTTKKKKHPRAVAAQSQDPPRRSGCHEDGAARREAERIVDRTLFLRSHPGNRPPPNEKTTKKKKKKHPRAPPRRSGYHEAGAACREAQRIVDRTLLLQPSF